jgi:starvation-inducible DNA-binding protein
MQSVELLNRNLAMAVDLERQAKQAHWNVKGPNFIALHELFDKVAEIAEEFTDLLAERATALGGTAEGRLHAVVESSSLPRYPGEIVSGREHVYALSTALASFGKSARGDRRSRWVRGRRHGRCVHRDKPRDRQAIVVC